MHSPVATARKTIARTSVLELKTDAMLLGTMFRKTSSGLEEVEPDEVESPSRLTLNSPMSKTIIPTTDASSRPPAVDIKNHRRVLVEIRPSVRASETVPMAIAIEVKTIGTITTCKALTNSCPPM